jgi:hypothetical protein
MLCIGLSSLNTRHRIFPSPALYFSGQKSAAFGLFRGFLPNLGKARNHSVFLSREASKAHSRYSIIEIKISLTTVAKTMEIRLIYFEYLAKNFYVFYVIGAASLLSALGS